MITRTILDVLKEYIDAKINLERYCDADDSNDFKEADERLEKAEKVLEEANERFIIIAKQIDERIKDGK